ncbi:MAG: SPOR domain-containing protein [Undibacterium sp.]|uniref:SPOR domain-containing protein n=1 Tax=Undibacterium sp. TaxID=1914977 RepID=UPI0027258B8C|nr:SPOR domain-containing protein [Undibacterium sp.]MDO8653390.1 SPOR domain-containing protein [Undibacterium sp.]
MGLLSLFKQKQEASEDTDNGEFCSRSEAESKSARAGTKRAQTQNQSARKNKAVDPVLPEKKRARRRLIGALALVFAAVIGLPMLLDSEPKPLADDINIQIPSKDKPLTSSSSGTGMTPSVATGKSKVTNNATDTEPLEEIIAAPVAVANKGKLVASDPLAITPSASKNSVTQSLPVAKKNDSIASVKSDQKIDSKAEPKSKPLTPVTIKPPVKTAHTEVIDEPVSNGASKTETAGEAARAMSILEGKVPAKIADKPDVADKAHSGYVVQVAALVTQEKVNELQGKLKSASIKSYTQKVATTSGEKIRVRVGPFSSKEEAEKTRAKLIKLGLSGTLIPL